MEVSREIQIDAGHRIPLHKAKCCNVHGHRYRIIATLEGTVVEKEDVSDLGMVMDFGDLKHILTERVHDPLDHGFMVWKEDTKLMEFLLENNFKVIVFDCVPTAENLARWCYEQMVEDCKSRFGNQVRLKSIVVWETPNSSATYAP